MNCRIVSVLVVVCLFQDCNCEGDSLCKPYKESTIREYCVELKVENANVCYNTWYVKRRQYYTWEARITCHEGYKSLPNSTNPVCYKPGNRRNYRWSDPNQTKCAPDNIDEANNLVRDVAMPILIVVLVGAVLCFVIKELVSRRNIRCLLNGTSCFKTNREQRQFQRDHSLHVDDTSVVYNITVDSESEYHCIEDEDFDLDKVSAIDDENGEYNILHKHLDARPKDRNELPSQINVYAHTTNSVSDTNEEMDTYSHINETKANNKSFRLHYDDITVGLREQGEDSLYNQTNTRLDTPICAISVIENYAHVNSDLNITDADLSDKK